MNNIKPSLIDNNFLNRFINHETKKKSIKFNNFINLSRNNIIIVLFISLLAYILYYRYNNKTIKTISPQNNINIIPPLLPSSIKQMQQQIPSNNNNQQIPQQIPQQMQPNNNLPRQLYLSKNNNPIQREQTHHSHHPQNNTFNGQNDISIEHMTNEIDPINLNQNNYYLNKDNLSNQIHNPNDLSLRSMSKAFLTPQYIGDNYSPLL